MCAENLIPAEGNAYQLIPYNGMKIG